MKCKPLYVTFIKSNIWNMWKYILYLQNFKLVHLFWEPIKHFDILVTNITGNNLSWSLFFCILTLHQGSKFQWLGFCWWRRSDRTGTLMTSCTGLLYTDNDKLGQVRCTEEYRPMYIYNYIKSFVIHANYTFLGWIIRILNIQIGISHHPN